MKTIELEFIGYYRDRNDDEIIDTSGIYCVYAINEKAKTGRLIYIGEAKDVKDRLSDHEKYDDWWAELRENETTLYYSCAKVSSTDRKRAEAALIYKHQPTVNDLLKDNFSHPDTTIEITGITLGLKTKFTVETTT